MSLSDEKKMLLFKGLKNNGRVTINMAEMLYSSKHSAKSALQTLQMRGFLGPPNFGTHHIKKVPSEVMDMYEEWKRSKQEEDEDGIRVV